jgi:hypothetical protein
MRESEQALIEEARRHHRRRLWSTAALISAAVVAGAWTFVAFGGGSGTVMVPSGVNAVGQSYGSSAGTSWGKGPDLVAVYATNGRRGYAYQTAMNAVDGSNVSSPAEALAWMKNGAIKPHYVAVYLSDGKTRIGTFQIGPGRSFSYQYPNNS